MDKVRLDRLFSQGYTDLEAFYEDDMRRVYSGEVDFGVQWRGAASFPSYQLSWVVNTGELYLQELRGMSAGRVVVISVIEGRDELEHSLKGWETACGPTGSLQWLLDWDDLGKGLDRTSTPGAGRSAARVKKASLEFRDPSQLLYG